MVGFNRNKEYAVIIRRHASCFLCSFCPKWRVVTVVALVLLTAPRISHLHKPDVFCAIIDLFDAKDSVGMSVGEAYCVLSRVVAAKGSALHDVLSLISSLQRVP